MFGENQRISHRQLYRQIVLALMAPFLLCLPGWQGLRGINGIVGIVITLLIWAWYVIFLVRLSPAYDHLPRYLGKIHSLVIAVIYGIFLILTGGYFLNLGKEITVKYLLTDIPSLFVLLLLAFVCVVGSHMGMEKRGRMGEVSFAIVFGALVLLVALSVLQGQHFSAEEFMGESLLIDKVGVAFYTSFCGFMPLTVLPFVLGKVEKSASAGRCVYGSLWIIGGLLMVILFLLPVLLGWDRMIEEDIPILPYLAGTNLPGDVLARFDVIWIAILLYGLLFSIGSTFYYCSHIFQSIHVNVSHFIWGALSFLVAAVEVNGYGINYIYERFFLPVMAPVLFLTTWWIYFMYRRKKS